VIAALALAAAAGTRCPTTLPAAAPAGARLIGSARPGAPFEDGQITTVRPAEATVAAMGADAVTYDSDEVTNGMRQYRIAVRPSRREPYTLVCGYGPRNQSLVQAAWLLYPLAAERTHHCSIRWQWERPRAGQRPIAPTAGCA
jgi:hypothetical protein